jgi:hypothetical protein
VAKYHIHKPIPVSILDIEKEIDFSDESDDEKNTNVKREEYNVK